MQLVNQEILLHVSLIEDVGPQVCGLLLERFPDLSELYALTPYELHEKTGLFLHRAEKIVEGLADTLMLDREKILLEKHDVSLVTVLDTEYPALLRTIHAPPAVFYYRGNLSILSKALAFVGSRKADTYGQQVVNHLIPAVVQEAFATVSGGALGIDGMVHRATLNAGGKTVAVLGSGLLELYPTQHTGLFEEIVYSGGLIMSEFPLLMQPLPGNFPARNRIIAGLSPATMVIQAARKSGALITARNAIDEGREVGVVPGSIFNEISQGCHDLLAQGAQSITSPDDIYELIGYTSKNTRRLGKIPAASNTASKDPLVALCITPKSTDELLLKAGYSYDTLQERLWQLQIEGRIEQNMLGMWCSLE